jgi:poly(A) polymerase Pap1
MKLLSYVVRLFVWLFGTKQDQKCSSVMLERLQADRKKLQLLMKKEAEERQFKQRNHLTLVYSADAVIVPTKPKIDVKKQYQEWRECVKKYDELRNLMY